MSFNKTKECYECVRFLQTEYGIKPTYVDVYQAVAFKHKDEDENLKLEPFRKLVANVLVNMEKKGKLKREKNDDDLWAYFLPESTN